MYRKAFTTGAAFAMLAIGGQGFASADMTDYDSLNGPWPTEAACQTAAANLNSNGRNPTTECYQIAGRDGWYFRYAVIID
ncbi:hypothetical protein [Nocardia sp. SSK8]|uniref:hypothetical protein n=1 Tax=Nocardia sp. SSK8 TaxID=3120154 RepID=UPI003008655F